MKKHQGFSLIELMIVVAIIGVLAAIAIPSYKQYTNKAQFSEVVALTTPYKTAITLALYEGTPLKDLKNGTHGIPLQSKPSKYVASIDVNNGIITATTTQQLDHVTYILTPNSDGTRWKTSGTCQNNGLCR